jgi:hypothetical protein
MDTSGSPPEAIEKNVVAGASFRPAHSSSRRRTPMPEPTAQKTQSTFRQDCSVRCDIHAPPSRIWALLTDAPAFPKWNSTVIALGGKIAEGEKLSIRSTAAPDRTFTPRVTKLAKDQEMVWSDGFAPMFRGVRTFTLREKPGGVTEFAMAEVFSGAMLPMIRGTLPDFVPLFEAFARDLKRAAEQSA